jgi:hypothetical protein
MVFDATLLSWVGWCGYTHTSEPPVLTGCPTFPFSSSLSGVHGNGSVGFCYRAVGWRRC